MARPQRFSPEMLAQIAQQAASQQGQQVGRGGQAINSNYAADDDGWTESQASAPNPYGGLMGGTGWQRDAGYAGTYGLNPFSPQGRALMAHIAQRAQNPLSMNIEQPVDTSQQPQNFAGMGDQPMMSPQQPVNPQNFMGMPKPMSPPQGPGEFLGMNFPNPQQALGGPQPNPADQFPGMPAPPEFGAAGAFQSMKAPMGVGAGQATAGVPVPRNPFDSTGVPQNPAGTNMQFDNPGMNYPNPQETIGGPQPNPAAQFPGMPAPPEFGAAGAFQSMKAPMGVGAGQATAGGLGGNPGARLQQIQQAPAAPDTPWTQGIQAPAIMGGERPGSWASAQGQPATPDTPWTQGIQRPAIQPPRLDRAALTDFDTSISGKMGGGLGGGGDRWMGLERPDTSISGQMGGGLGGNPGARLQQAQQTPDTPWTQGIERPDTDWTQGIERPDTDWTSGIQAPEQGGFKGSKGMLAAAGIAALGMYLSNKRKRKKGKQKVSQILAGR